MVRAIARAWGRAPGGERLRTSTQASAPRRERQQEKRIRALTVSDDGVELVGHDLEVLNGLHDRRIHARGRSGRCHRRHEGNIVQLRQQAKGREDEMNASKCHPAIGHTMGSVITLRRWPVCPLPSRANCTVRARTWRASMRVCSEGDLDDSSALDDELI